MSNGPGMGPQALKAIAEIWKVDDARSRWRDDGFDWWPGDFRVSVNAFRRVDGLGPETWLLSVRTDFLKDVPVDDPKFVRLAAVTSRFLASTYSWVYPTAEVWEQHGQPETLPKLWFSNTAYVTSDNVDWLPGFLAWMSIMQPVNAQIQAKEAPEFLAGGVPDVSRPEAPGVSGLHDTLEIAAQVYVPIGRKVNRWIGTSEFSAIAEKWGTLDHCYGNGDPQGLTLETSFGDDTALIRLRTDEKHPQLGNGLLATLQVPFFGEPKLIADECAGLNLLETLWTDIPQFGCWHPHASRGEREGLAFSTFVPNALHQAGLATQTTLWMLQRARWLRQERWPHLSDKPVLEILQERANKGKETH
jgi:hypothetical protein